MAAAKGAGRYCTSTAEIVCCFSFRLVFLFFFSCLDTNPELVRRSAAVTPRLTRGWLRCACENVAAAGMSVASVHRDRPGVPAAWGDVSVV